MFTIQASYDIATRELTLDKQYGGSRADVSSVEILFTVPAEYNGWDARFEFGVQVPDERGRMFYPYVEIENGKVVIPGTVLIRCTDGKLPIQLVMESPAGVIIASSNIPNLDVGDAILATISLENTFITPIKNAFFNVEWVKTDLTFTTLEGKTKSITVPFDKIDGDPLDNDALKIHLLDILKRMPYNASKVTGGQFVLWDGKEAVTRAIEQSDIVNLNSVLSGLTGRIATAESDIGTIKSQITGLNTTFGVLDGRVTTAESKLSGIESGAQKNKVDSVNGKTGAVVLTSADVGARPSGKVPWADIDNVPATFTPSAHKHVKADVTDFAHGHEIADVTGLSAVKDKVDGIEAGAQVNKIETIKVNGIAQAITSKSVDVITLTNKIDVASGVTGDVLTKQSDGTFKPAAPASGGSGGGKQMYLHLINSSLAGANPPTSASPRFRFNMTVINDSAAQLNSNNKLAVELIRLGSNAMTNAHTCAGHISRGNANANGGYYILNTIHGSGSAGNQSLYLHGIVIDGRDSLLNSFEHFQTFTFPTAATITDKVVML